MRTVSESQVNETRLEHMCCSCDAAGSNQAAAAAAKATNPQLLPLFPLKLHPIVQTVAPFTRSIWMEGMEQDYGTGKAAVKLNFACACVCVLTKRVKRLSPHVRDNGGFVEIIDEGGENVKTAAKKI